MLIIASSFFKLTFCLFDVQVSSRFHINKINHLKASVVEYRNMAATEGGIDSELLTDAIVLFSMDEFKRIAHMRTPKRESHSVYMPCIL